MNIYLSTLNYVKKNEKNGKSSSSLKKSLENSHLRKKKRIGNEVLKMPVHIERRVMYKFLFFKIDLFVEISHIFLRK